MMRRTLPLVCCIEFLLLFAVGDESLAILVVYIFFSVVHVNVKDSLLKYCRTARFMPAYA